MPNRERYTAQQVADALTQAKGLVYIAAGNLGCTDETINNYAKRYKMVADAKRQARGKLIDVAEAKLWQAVNEGEPWAVTFALKNLAKDRGYVERQEVSGPDGAALIVEIVRRDAGDTAAH